MSDETRQRNYCNFTVNNFFDKLLQIHWGGDIWGGWQVQNIPATSYTTVPSRNIRRKGADLVFRYHIYRIRSDNTLHDIGLGDFGFKAPAVINCPDTTIWLSGIADSPNSFGFYITYWYGWPETRRYSHKLASVPLAQWMCETFEECSYLKNPAK